jgi:hypothetical protein
MSRHRRFIDCGSLDSKNSTHRALLLLSLLLLNAGLEMRGHLAVPGVALDVERRHRRDYGDLRGFSSGEPRAGLCAVPMLGRVS